MLIGLHGYKGTGKDTVAQILREDYNFHIVSFASHLKDVAAQLFFWPRDLVDGTTPESREWREKPDEFWSKAMDREFTPREALQKLGTEAMRNQFHTDFWVYALKRYMETSPYQNFVITDARFPNEARFVQNQGGFYVRVVRGNDPSWGVPAAMENYEAETQNREPNQKILLDRWPDAHYSEWAVLGKPSIKVDYILDNNGTLPALTANVDHMMKVFTGAKNNDF